MKRLGFTFLIIIVVLFTSGCTEKKVIDVQYGVCPIEQYPCTSQSVTFRLPEGHDAVQITLVTSKAGAFVKNMGDAMIGMPKSFGLYTNNSFTANALEILSSGIDVIATVVQKDEQVYIDYSTIIAQAVSGFRPAIYHCRFLEKDGSLVYEDTMPIGSTTFVVSSKVQFLEITARVEINGIEYTDGKTEGFVRYDNAYEIRESDTPLVPNSGVRPSLEVQDQLVQNANSDIQPLNTNDDTSIDNQIQDKASSSANEFDIKGVWLCIGDQGFGQAQPGYTVTFDETTCNFYSPQDTYTLYIMNSGYYLELTSLLFKEKLGFHINADDPNNIEVYNYLADIKMRRIQ